MSGQNYFVCQNCGKKVPLDAPGTRHRNHCPFCLYSVHLDKKVGDRAAECGGSMKPIGKTFKKDGEEMIVHKCEKCGVTSKNRIAGDDSFEGVEKLEVVA
jgi:DNA-directed RNA polymerase subunit RPC12/RpoP